MEKKILTTCALLSLIAGISIMTVSCSKVEAEQGQEPPAQPLVPSNATDSLALVKLHETLDGKYWKASNKEVGWELDRPMSEWYGVTMENINGEMRVVTLFLNGLGLDGEIPVEIGLLSELRTLDLKYNSIKGDIPKEIGDLSKLEKLYLDENKFTGELPISIANLKKLTELTAAKNRLKIFPVEICSIDALTYLKLDNNEISSVPGEIVSMSSLEYLYLNNNRLTTLPTGLDKLPKLIYLHANNNMIESFPAEIGALTNLLSLNLSNNNIGGEIPVSIVNLIGLKYFYASNNHLTGVLPSGMDKMAALESFEMDNNSLSGTLPDFGLNPNIKKLSLVENNFTGNITEYFQGALNLEWLMLGGNKLTGAIPAALASIQTTPKLTYIDLSDNNLEGTVAEGFYDQLSKWNPTFNKLGFRVNGNKLNGAIPEKLFTLSYGVSATVKNYKFETNLYPQQTGFGFTNEKR